MSNIEANTISFSISRDATSRGSSMIPLKTISFETSEEKKRRENEEFLKDLDKRDLEKALKEIREKAGEIADQILGEKKDEKKK